MLSPVIYLMMNGIFFTLRLSGGGGSFPRPLKAAEEKEYLERCAQGDLEARNLLVEHNLRLVAHIVKKYYAQTGDQDDLISIGTIGLIKGISTFKADKNVRLATYASRCIENAILTKVRAFARGRGRPLLLWQNPDVLRHFCPVRPSGGRRLKQSQLLSAGARQLVNGPHGILGVGVRHPFGKLPPAPLRLRNLHDKLDRCTCFQFFLPPNSLSAAILWPGVCPYDFRGGLGHERGHAPVPDMDGAST